MSVRLAAVLVVPVVLALSLGISRVAGQVQVATELGGRDRYLVLAEWTSELEQRLQRERAVAAVLLARGDTDRAALSDAVGATDAGWAELRAVVGDPAALSSEPLRAFQQVGGAVSRLAELRDHTGVDGVDTAGLLARYTGVIETLVVFASTVHRQLNTPELAGPATALSALDAAREHLSLEHAVIAVAIARGGMSAADAEAVQAAEARLGSAIARLRAGLDGSVDAAARQRLVEWVGGDADRERTRLTQSALSRAGKPAEPGISATDWDNGVAAVLTELGGAQSTLREQVRAASVAAQEKARDAAGINSVVLLLGMLAAAAVVYLVGRSLLTPLRELRRAALDVADRRLPRALATMCAGQIPGTSIEPVGVATKDEIGQVARAFDAVHGQAMRLAAEQARLQAGVSSMFVNLSRRSQGLVERQLTLIEGLEHREQDSEQLANLFRLDHLATRMRRNSENLLVLAGSELVKRANQAVPILDVLRAAVSEIEQYQRVFVKAPPEVAILGRAANDLVHLVAELLDNATSFSPPDSQVVISSIHAPNGSVLVKIADQGVGMPAERLIAANTQLAGPIEVNVSASRRMGLFVVGRLASRHGIGVRLASTDPHDATTPGVTASVHILEHLVTSVPPRELDRTVDRPIPPPAGEHARDASSTAGEYPPPDAIIPDARRPVEQDQEEFPRTPIFDELASAWFGGNWSRPAPGGRTEPPPFNWSDDDILRPMPEVKYAADSGLPIRKPGSQLIPRGFESLEADQPPDASSRTPEKVRSLLAGYQEGSRQARTSRAVEDERVLP